MDKWYRWDLTPSPDCAGFESRNYQAYQGLSRWCYVAWYPPHWIDYNERQSRHELSACTYRNVIERIIPNTEVGTPPPNVEEQIKDLLRWLLEEYQQEQAEQRWK